jgi:hypothetical protein
MPTPAKELHKELRYGNVNAHRYFDCPHYQKCRNCAEFKEYKKMQGATKLR